MISLININHSSSEGEQWGRYNLPSLNTRNFVGECGAFPTHHTQTNELPGVATSVATSPHDRHQLFVHIFARLEGRFSLGVPQTNPLVI